MTDAMVRDQQGELPATQGDHLVDLGGWAAEAQDCLPVPAGLAKAFAPASHYLFEWTDYHFHCPGADRLLVGELPLHSRHGQWFRVRFENQLGLCTLRPFAGSMPAGQPLCVEVISRKFPSPDAHLSLYKALLDDLWSQAVQLPFTFEGATGRAVAQSRLRPTPLFVFHFLLHHAPKLQAAIGSILQCPHRKLVDISDTVPLAAVSEADADVLISILHTPAELVRTTADFPLAARLGGRLPRRVWQHLPEESLDTPENRFVRRFLTDLQRAADALPRQSWWPKVDAARQRPVREVRGHIEDALRHPVLEDVGEMTRLPSSSRVLMQRDGYREMREFWQLFQMARRPVFARLAEAMSVRDVATLYEFWVFFSLCEQLEAILGEPLVIKLNVTDEAGLKYTTRASFGRRHHLYYNRGYHRPLSYSMALRPDFTLNLADRAPIVLDAKFRLDWQQVTRIEGAEDDPAEAPSARAVAELTDLYKMHTYRDALRDVDAAVAVYPGECNVFYHADGSGPDPSVTLRRLVEERHVGIGALAMRPFAGAGQ